MLGADVRRIGLARHLLEADCFIPNPLLNPKLPDSQVPDAPYATAAADADRGGRVGKERKRLRNAQIRRDGLGAEALAGPVHHSSELGLGG